ncbi:MAG: hypothetical protein MUO36_02370 [Candidatus Hadarchaeum sp.]|jgi:hypothetical protein|nr:hypothetical protein [Candidatus Hadarchaeum sp.]
MGKVATVCAICGRVTIDVYRCGICGETVCSSCFARDVNVCARCMRRGLWVGDRGPGEREL